MDHSDRTVDAADTDTVRVQTYSAPADHTDKDARSAGREVADEARRRSQEVADKVVREAGQVAGRFRDQAGSALSEGKTQLAEQIGGVARALKASSGQLRGDELGGLADLSDALAGQVETTQRYLREKSGDALLGDIQTFARRRRGLFVGSLLFAGLLTAHFAGRGTPERTAPKRTVNVRRRGPTVVARGGVKTYRTGPS